MKHHTPTPIIRAATDDDLDVVKLIADANRQHIGFVIRAALAESVQRGWLYVAEQAGQIVGFVHFRVRRDGWVTVYEICVKETLRRCGIGGQLIAAARVAGNPQGQPGLRLKCPLDNPANDFYATLGLTRQGIEPGKRRPLVLWLWHGA